MSKGKNQNKNNNKSSKVPVKSQPMKAQKAAVIKPIQVAANKNNQKAVVKPLAKPVAKTASIKIPEVNKKQLKPTKQEVDIAESDEDEDEDGVEFDDSDIDDVDLGDSDDEDVSDEDDDLSIEEIDNSDLESIELDEDNIKSDGDSEDDDEVELKKETIKVVKKEPVKAVEKKEPVKAVEKKEPVKAVEKKEPIKVVEKKEPVKVVEKKEPAKVVEKKETVDKVIDPTTKEGKVLIEINRRKNYSNEVVVFVNKVPVNFTRDAISQVLKENKLSVVHINLPGKARKQNFKTRGYGFIRLAKTEDLKKAIEILNTKDFDGKKLKASSFVCKKVYDDINKVNFSKLIVQTFSDEDITEVINKHFKNAKVNKYLNTQYVLEFTTKEEANSTFNKETITIGGHKLVFNYLYAEKSSNINKATEIPEIPKVVANIVEKIEAKPVEVIVKAGVKRTNRESSSDEEVEIVKKTKMIDGSESATKVEKKVLTPKKSAEVAKIPEKKIMTPQNNKGEKKINNSPANGKFPFNKSPGEKKQFNKSPGDKKQFNKSPGDKKQFNKSPGDKKQFNKSPAGKKFPGNKKFNKK